MTGGMRAVLKTQRLRKHLLRGALAAVSWWFTVAGALLIVANNLALMLFVARGSKAVQP